MADVNKNRLTLNDMHIMYDSDVYEFMREKHGATIEWHDTYDSEGKRGFMEASVKMVGNWYSPNAPLLYRHIIAEQLLADYQNVDWYEVTLYTVYNILNVAELWMHPLVDCTWESICKLAIVGDIAKEEYAPDRKKEIRKVLDLIFRNRVLWFADHPFELAEDALFIGMTKGMWAWFFLTQGYNDLIDKVLNGERLDESEICACEPFNVFVLRENLNYIAKERNGVTAALLLRKLQEQWPKIKLWKAGGLDEMKEEDIIQFEQALFHGFDDLLAEWERGKEQEAVKPEEVEVAQTEKPNMDDVFSLRYRKTDDYGRLLDFLDNERKTASDGDWSRYALALYGAKIFVNKPNSFKRWLEQFGKLFEREVAYQEPNKLRRSRCKKSIEAYLPTW